MIILLHVPWQFCTRLDALGVHIIITVFQSSFCSFLPFAFFSMSLIDSK